MNGKTLLALNLGWLALVVVAFIAGTATRNEEPAPAEVGKSADPARITTMVGAPRSTELTGAGPEGRSPGAGVSASLGSGDPQESSRRVASTLQAIGETKAWQEAQLERYGGDLTALLDKITVENAPAMAEAYMEAFTVEHEQPVGDLFFEFFHAWGELSGPDAMEFLRGNASPTKGEAYAVVAEGWAETDPGAAVAYASNAADAGVKQYIRDNIHLGVVRALAETDLDGAIAHSASHEVGSGKLKQAYSFAALSEKIFEQRGADGIESWLATVEALHGEGEARDYKAELVARGLMSICVGGGDKEQARRWMAANVRKGLVDAETMTWASVRLSVGPEDRLAWLMMPDPADPEQQNDYAQLVGETFEEYLRSDFDAAGEWLAAQPRDQRNDGAIQRYALKAVRYDREAALIWVEEISDERLRAATLARPEFRERSTIVRP